MSAELSLLSFSNRKRLPVILQTEVAECGLACLAMIAGYYGHHIDLNNMRRLYSVSLKGMDLRGLMQVADKLHFSTRPLQLSLDELAQLQIPCILHWDMRHFVVLKKVTGKFIIIHDPANGEHRLSVDEASKHFTGIALELTPTSEFKPKEEKAKVRLLDFWQRISGLKRGLLQLLGLSLVLQLLSLASPFYMQLVVDEAVVSHDLELLGLLAFGFGLLSLISIAITVLRSWISLYLGSLLSFQMAVNLFRHLIHLPADYFAQRHIGDIVSRFGSMGPIKNMLTGGLIAAVLDGIMAVTTLIMIFLYSPLLSWVVLGSLVLYALVRIAAYYPLRRLTEEGIVAGAKENSHFMETLRAVQSVKLYGRETDRLSQWQNRYAETMNLGIRLGKLNIGFSTIHSLLSALENIIVVYLGAKLIIEGHFSIGMFYAFMSYKGQFSGAVSSLIDQAISLRMLGLHMERLADIALTPVEPGLSPDAPQPLNNSSDLHGDIQLLNLAYRYADGEPWVLQNANLHIPAGECVAIIGPSGCGKSTLLKLMIGLMPPADGKILIDGLTHGQWGLANFRRHIAVVMQDDQLLSGTLTDNICMFDPNIDMGRVEQVARMAAIYDDIQRMPMGFDSLVGDMGTSLSGGQKQRLLLARALYHQPRILFMDEATSHLDVAAEAGINQTLSQLSITRVVIAHRPQTIAMATRVFAVTQGQLHEVDKTQLFGGMSNESTHSH